MNDNDCCTEAIEILSDIWENVQPLPLETALRIGAFLAAKGHEVEIDIDIDTDPPDESNRNLEGEDL